MNVFCLKAPGTWLQCYVSDVINCYEPGKVAKNILALCSYKRPVLHYFLALNAVIISNNLSLWHLNHSSLRLLPALLRLPLVRDNGHHWQWRTRYRQPSRVPRWTRWTRRRCCSTCPPPPLGECTSSRKQEKMAQAQRTSNSQPSTNRQWRRWVS